MHVGSASHGHALAVLKPMVRQVDMAHAAGAGLDDTSNLARAVCPGNKQRVGAAAAVEASRTRAMESRFNMVRQRTTSRRDERPQL